MTTLSLLGGDFEILFDDETVGTNAAWAEDTISKFLPDD